MTQSLLHLSAISKQFGTVMALDDASLSVRPGTVHALLGENGAGKTTLMRIAYGLTRPDRGTISTDGIVRQLRSPTDAAALGIGMVQQHFSLVPSMTIADNVALGMSGRYSPRTNRQQLANLARELHWDLPADRTVAQLSVPAQQRVEILKALSRSARVLILDEPTAVLTPQEAEELLRWVRSFATAERAAVLITHKLQEARSIADDVTVLRGGRVTFAGAAVDVAPDELVQAMIGDARPGIERPAPRTSSHASACVRATSVSIRDEQGVYRVRDATVELHHGEIVGVAGVEGSGHDELLRALAGRLPPSSGTLSLPSSIGYIPDDRLRDALIPDLDLVHNFALRGASHRTGRMPWRSLADQVRFLLPVFDVRATGIGARVAELSGGNQQKFLFLRELSTHPELLIAVNPTRGLDIRASRALHERLQIVRESGSAIVIYSTDLDELLALANRILVVHAGHVREVPADRTIIGRTMLGARS